MDGFGSVALRGMVIDADYDYYVASWILCLQSLLYMYRFGMLRCYGRNPCLPPHELDSHCEGISMDTESSIAGIKANDPAKEASSPT